MAVALKVAVLLSVLAFAYSKRYVGKCSEEESWVNHVPEWHQHKYEQVYHFRAGLDIQNHNPICGKLNHFEDYEVDFFQTVFKYSEFVVRAVRVTSPLLAKRDEIDNSGTLIRILERRENKEFDVAQFLDADKNQPEFQYARVFHQNDKSMGIWTCVADADYVELNSSNAVASNKGDAEDTRFFLTIDPDSDFEKEDGYEYFNKGEADDKKFEGAIAKYTPSECESLVFI